MTLLLIRSKRFCSRPVCSCFEHGGLRGDRARSILGRWRKLVGHKNDPVLLGWIRDAQRDSVSDPVAYLEAVIKQHAKQSEFGAGYRPMPSAAGG